MLRASLRSLRQHKLRLALTILAIVAGVGFVAGTYVFTDSLHRAFEKLFEVPSPDVTVRYVDRLGDSSGQPPSLSQAPGTLPGSLVAKVGAVPGVRAAYGSVRDGSAVVIGPDGEPLTGFGAQATGLSWVPDDALRGLELTAGHAPHGSGEVVLLEQTATDAGVGVGDQVRIDTTAGLVRPRVVGTVSRSIAGTDGGTLVVFDLATAQRLLLDRPDRVTSVLVRADPGVDQRALAQRIEAVLPPEAGTQTGAERSADLTRRLQNAFTFLNTFLLAFAFIALFVASFLIYNTFTMLVAQRTRELALLRAVGASRGQVRRAVVAEAVVVGLVASGLGLLAGLGMSVLLRALIGRFGISLPGGPLVVLPRTVVVAVVVGLVVTVLSAYLPARRAARIAPVAAMREEVSLPTRALRTRTLLGVGLVAVAALLAWRAVALPDDVERAATLAGLSALAALIALIAVAPVVGRGALWLLGAPLVHRPVGRLARENGRRNPRRTAATAGALAIGLALMTAVGVIAASTKASVSEVVDDTVGADFLVLSSTLRPFSQDVHAALADTPGTAVVTYSRAVVLELGGERYPVLGVQPGPFGEVFEVTMTQGRYEDLAFGGALVDADTARQNDLHVGSSVRAQFVNGPGTLRIDGIYEPSGAAQGFIVSLPTLQSIGSLERDDAVYVRLAPGADPAVVRAELEQRLTRFPSLQVVDRTDLKVQIDEQFDRVFGFVYALLALAVVVAFLGIVNTLALSVHERRREVGLLRAVGTRRGQVRAMVILESVLIALLGGVIGIALGVAYGALLQRTLASEGIAVLAIPYGQLGWFVLAAVVGGFLAALWPATTAARMNVLRAIATE